MPYEFARLAGNLGLCAVRLARSLPGPDNTHDPSLPDTLNADTAAKRTV